MIYHRSSDNSNMNISSSHHGRSLTRRKSWSRHYGTVAAVLSTFATRRMDGTVGRYISMQSYGAGRMLLGISWS